MINNLHVHTLSMKSVLLLQWWHFLLPNPTFYIASLIACTEKGTRKIRIDAIRIDASWAIRWALDVQLQTPRENLSCPHSLTIDAFYIHSNTRAGPRDEIRHRIKNMHRTKLNFAFPTKGIFLYCLRQCKPQPKMSRCLFLQKNIVAKLRKMARLLICVQTGLT